MLAFAVDFSINGEWHKDGSEKLFMYLAQKWPRFNWGHGPNT